MGCMEDLKYGLFLQHFILKKNEKMLAVLRHSICIRLEDVKINNKMVFARV